VKSNLIVISVVVVVVFNSKVFFLSHRYSIVEKQTIDSLVSELIIDSTERSDSGQFGCIAYNLYGQSDMNTQLLVEEVPDAPNPIEIVDISSRSVSLKWSIPFSGNNPISKYIIQWKTKKGFPSLTHTLFEFLISFKKFLSLLIDLWDINSYSTEFTTKTETQISITDLKPLTEYNFRIFAINAIGKSEFSEISAKTDEESK
jgi:hypothetical protein